jgi:hypothetical protein
MSVTILHLSRQFSAFQFARFTRSTRFYPSSFAKGYKVESEGALRLAATAIVTADEQKGVCECHHDSNQKLE